MQRSRGTWASGVVDGPVISSTGTSRDGMTACVEGLLTHDGGCIGLGDRATIWPEGTAWDEQAQQLRLPSGESALIGDRISGGGGFLSVSHVRALFGDAVANACGDAEEVAVFNPGEPLAVTRA